MGFAALILPEPLESLALPAGVDIRRLEELRDEGRTLFESVRMGPPEEGSPEENVALSRMTILFLGMAAQLGSWYVELLRAGVNTRLSDLVRRELEAAELERKFALRQIEQATNTFGVFMESVGASFGAMDAATLKILLSELIAMERRGELSFEPDDRVLLRFQLSLTVALECLDAPLTELTFWAYRASVGARQVQALPVPALPPGFRGELARARSRRSWLTWGADEIDEELKPWPPLAPSR